MDLIVWICFKHYCQTEGQKTLVARSESVSPLVYDGTAPTVSTTNAKLVYDGKAKNLDPDLWEPEHVVPGLICWLVHGPVSENPCAFVDPGEIKASKSDNAKKKEEVSL